MVDEVCQGKIETNNAAYLACHQQTVCGCIQKVGMVNKVGITSQCFTCSVAPLLSFRQNKA